MDEFKNISDSPETENGETGHPSHPGENATKPIQELRKKQAEKQALKHMTTINAWQMGTLNKTLI
eukprot:5902171-Amphidinium_carterae.1